MYSQEIDRTSTRNCHKYTRICLTLHITGAPRRANFITHGKTKKLCEYAVRWRLYAVYIYII